MKVLLLSMIAAVSCLAQFRSIEIQFHGIGCASCVESMQSRIARVRGVESVSVDAPREILKMQLAAQNRVRVEQVRDMIEQDGTKTVRAVVRVKGDLVPEQGQWVLRPAGVAASYLVQAETPAAGPSLVAGEISDLRPASGTMVIRAKTLESSH